MPLVMSPWTGGDSHRNSMIMKNLCRGFFIWLGLWLGLDEKEKMKGKPTQLGEKEKQKLEGKPISRLKRRNWGKVLVGNVFLKKFWFVVWLEICERGHIHERKLRETGNQRVYTCMYM
jgi:hypothetical protein